MHHLYSGAMVTLGSLVSSAVDGVGLGSGASVSSDFVGGAELTSVEPMSTFVLRHSAVTLALMFSISANVDSSASSGILSIPSSEWVIVVPCRVQWVIVVPCRVYCPSPARNGLM